MSSLVRRLFCSQGRSPLGHKPARRAFRGRMLSLEPLEERALLTCDSPVQSPFDAAAGLAFTPAIFDCPSDHRDAGHEETHVHVFPGVDDLLPPEAIETGGRATPASTSAALPLSAIPALSSLPGAAATLYLDFDGHYEAVWGSYNNVTTPAYDQDGDASTFTDSEIASITQIWQRVAEDYSPFNINVTTVLPASFANGAALRVSIGGNGSWFGNAGGVGYLNSFTNSIVNTVYVFSKNLSNGHAKYTAEASSHEAGHGFGLEHQSLYDGNRLVDEYYSGPGNGRAPIMGNSYSATRGTWWYGTTTSSSTYQDDMSMIARSTNGFGYRSDDHGNSAEAATPLTVSDNLVFGGGVITSTADVDYFSFTAGEGPISMTVNVASGINNLDARLELRDAAGSLIAAVDPSNSFGGTLAAYLAAGSYRLVVASHGTYGDVGQYSIIGAVQPPTSTPTIEAPTGLTAIATSTHTVMWWNDNATNETGYAVQRSTDGVNFSHLATLVANAKNFGDITAQPGVTYTYRVYAFNSVANSAFSNTASATVPSGTPQVSLSVADSAAAETLSTQTANPGQFVVSRTGSTAQSLTVNLTIGGTATNGSDYVPLGTSVIIPAGAASASIFATPQDDSFAEGQESVVLSLAGGAGYTVNSAQASGTVVINDNEIVRPPNDNFQNRIVLTGANVSTTGTNIDATRQSGEPRNAGVAGGRSVWWTWTAPASGTVVISTAGSNFDTTLGIYYGTSFSSMANVASNDDENFNAGIVTSRAVFTAVAGRAYQISVDGYNGAAGNIVLTISSSSGAGSFPAAVSHAGETIASNRDSGLEAAAAWQRLQKAQRLRDAVFALWS
jgi:hypothetical protein